jgi:hypothetical protein
MEGMAMPVPPKNRVGAAPDFVALRRTSMDLQ